MIFVSLLTFIDEFDLFRNMYRTLIKVYLIIITFSFRERARRFNVLSLTLKLHKSNFDNIVASLQSMYDLNNDLYLNIKGIKIFVCIFTLAYLKNIS